MKLSREFKKGDKTVAIVMTLEGEMLETVVSTGGKVERVSGEASTDSFGDYSKLVQAKLKAGFVPGPLANAPAVAEELLVRSLTVFGLSDLLEIFTEAEREEIVLREIQKAEAAGKAIGPYGDGYAALDLAELMMKCPNRALLRHLLACLHDGRLTKLYASGTTIDLDVFARTIANAARVPANRDWIIEEITRALATAEPELKKWLKARIAKFGQQTKLETALNSVPARPAALEESLLEEIGKDPANDAPRQVWADWLQERGSPWGEVVGLQCEEARLAAKPWSDATQARIDTIGERLRAIEPRARAKFLEPIKAFISDSDIERGLLNRVTASLEKLLKPGAAEAVILRAPSAELSLAGVKKAHGPQLAALPTGRFSSLKLFTSPGFNDADALALTASEFGKKLETLEIKTEALGDKGGLALMTIPALESNLTLTGMTLSAATAKKLRAFKADYQQWRQ